MLINFWQRLVGSFLHNCLLKIFCEKNDFNKTFYGDRVPGLNERTKIVEACDKWFYYKDLLKFSLIGRAFKYSLYVLCAYLFSKR